MELTNNEVERDLRPWVLDRKTWFFCGHDESARRAADALTIITTCKKLGLVPRRYIRDTLLRILDGEKNFAALLPEKLQAADRAIRGVAANASRASARVGLDFLAHEQLRRLREIAIEAIGQHEKSFPDHTMP